MRGKIEVELEVSDGHVAQDIVKMLELQLPYIADNVIVRSSWGCAYCSNTATQQDDLLGEFVCEDHVDDDVAVCGSCGHGANEHHDTADAFCDVEGCVCGGLTYPGENDMSEEDADLHKRDTLRSENPIWDLIMKAWEAGKLRYQVEEPDLDKPVILDYSTTGMSGIEFQYEPEDDRILFAMRTIDGHDIEVAELIKMMDDEVNGGQMTSSWIVTQRTWVSEAINEEQAIDRVNKGFGHQEVIEQTAEVKEES